MSATARLATEDPAVVFVAIHRGVRRSVTKQARAYRPLLQEADEKCGLPLGHGNKMPSALTGRDKDKDKRIAQSLLEEFFELLHEHRLNMMTRLCQGFRL